jgi:hypothetical protein
MNRATSPTLNNSSKAGASEGRNSRSVTPDPPTVGKRSRQSVSRAGTHACDAASCSMSAGRIEISICALLPGAGPRQVDAPA